MPSTIHLPAAQKVTDFRIEQLFGSKTRARLLSLFLENPERAFYVRELTRRIDAQLNSVRRELKNLVELGMVLEVEGKIIPSERDAEEAPEGQKFEKKKYYRAHSDFPLFEDLRAVLKKAAVLMNNRLVHEFKDKGRIDLLLLTGRFADRPQVGREVGDRFLSSILEGKNIVLANELGAV
ncbi:hypothetical protein HYS28_00075 [Candidatus Uhrbacteria bacterium]|nr:hypothetical protein [Candidatus Uhrbacteria bacterium]